MGISDVFRRVGLGFLAAQVILLFAMPVAAIEKPQEEMQDVGINRKLGQNVDLNLKFTNSSGQTGTLRELATPGKPFMLVPVYYECPRLCGLLLSGVLSLLNELDLEMGREFEVLTVSFDPTEGTELASKRAAEYRARLTKTPADPQGWRFFTGEKASVDALMNQIGFQYKPDGEDFAHTAAVIILTPDGEISQYFTGIEFSPWDVRLALIEASQGKVGSLLDQVLLFCFRYDHIQGRYTWAAFNFVRVGAILTMLILTTVIYRTAKKGLTREA